MAAERTYTLKALTDIWTGDANGKPGRLIATGLLGSIRWWLEVLVRGLGGSACDPSHHKDNKPGPCPADAIKDPLKPGHHCVVCELFGCTGWARKFRFEVLDENDQPKQSQIRRGETFKLRFTEVRPIRQVEWFLLDLALRLIAEYGAIGGKTVYKPSDEQNRQNRTHHRDYGLIEISQRAAIASKTQEELSDYIQQPRWRRVDHDGFAWASLKNFWCVKGRYLARQSANASTFNKVIGRPESKHQSNQGDSWLAGRRAGRNQSPESKKVFSFAEPQDVRRTFGFVKHGPIDFDDMRSRLRQAWRDLQDGEFLEGLRDILPRLLGIPTRGTL